MNLKNNENLPLIDDTLLLIVVLCMSVIFWFIVNASTTLPDNNTMMYPLKSVSKVECRMTKRTEHSQDCKIALPRINDANYKKYINKELYTKIYTMRWKWSYEKDDWNTAWSHAWVDIASAKWTPTYAIADGVVHEARQQAWYWNVVKIKFKRKWKTYYATYAHLSSIAPWISKWKSINQGDKLWEVWNSGFAGGGMWWYHLHFEIDKQIDWRLIYAFRDCDDRDMWANEAKVVDKWLCRDKLEARTADPIV